MNAKRLKAIMETNGTSVRALAKTTGIFRLILYFKLWGLLEFTLDEIVRLAKALNLSEQKVEQIFFAKKFPKGNK